MPYRLIPNQISRDTVTALETLLELAKTGELTGIAFAATFQRMRYVTNVAGLCFTNPTFTRGMVAAMDDELAMLVHGRDPDHTR